MKIVEFSQKTVFCRQTFEAIYQMFNAFAAPTEISRL